MAWTTPMTAVANTALTAAQWNAHVRDNFLETSPAKATASGQMFVATGTNAIAARTPSGATVATSQTTTSTAYVDLTTAGPIVTVTTGTKAIVSIAANMDTNTTANPVYASYAVSGATTIAANDAWCILRDAITQVNPNRWGVTHFVDTLNPGSNTFTMKYKSTTSTTATFLNRTIVVIPL